VIVLNIVVKWLIPVLCIWEVQGLNLSPETGGFPDLHVYGFSHLLVIVKIVVEMKVQTL
jgi:hypothetical protein